MSSSQIGKPLWAQQIHTVRKRLGLSQAELAEKLSTTQSNVAKWEKGSEHKPSPQHFVSLAQLVPLDVEHFAFLEHAGVTSDFFMGKTSKGLIPNALAEAAVRKAETKRLSEIAASGELTEMEGSIRHVPLLKDAAAAGTPRMIDEKEIERLVPLPREWVSAGGTLYMVKVKGDSMDPIILDGHIVIVDMDRRDLKKLVNSMVLARDRDDAVTVKWLREDDGEYLLVPNHVSVRHPVRRIRRGGDLTVIGEVVKWIGEPPRPPRRR